MFRLCFQVIEGPDSTKRLCSPGIRGAEPLCVGEGVVVELGLARWFQRFRVQVIGTGKRLVAPVRAGCVECARRRKVHAFLRGVVNGLLRIPR